MHEASLMRNLMAQIERLAEKEGANEVTRIQVNLGALSHFSKEHFLEHFEIASKDTVAEAARVDVILSEDIHSPGAQDVVLESIDFEIGR